MVVEVPTGDFYGCVAEDGFEGGGSDSGSGHHIAAGFAAVGAAVAGVDDDGGVDRHRVGTVDAGGGGLGTQLDEGVGAAGRPRVGGGSG